MPVLPGWPSIKQPYSSSRDADFLQKYIADFLHYTLLVREGFDHRSSGDSDESRGIRFMQ